jgi:hypothetical protein
MVLVAGHLPAVGQDDLGANQRIGGDPVRPTQDPEPAAERQAAHTDRRTGAAWDGERMLVQRLVYVAERRAGANGDEVPRDRDRVHRPNVYEHAARC